MSASSKTNATGNTDGMMSIPFSHSKIKQVLESFLVDSADATACDSTFDTAAIVMDDLFENFGIRVRIIAQKRQDGHTIALHVGIIGMELIRDQYLIHLKSTFGKENVFLNETASKLAKKKDCSTVIHPLESVAEGYDICVRVMSDKLPSGLNAEQICILLSQLHFTILGGDLQQAFRDLANSEKKESPTFSIPIQRHKSNPQCIVVNNQNDRVTVIIPFAFLPEHEIDCALAKLFLQQFQPAQRKCLNERHGRNVPMVDYFRSNNPPREIRGHEHDHVLLVHAGYLSLTFLEYHVDNEEKIHKAVTNVLMLHPFLDYHVKCSKSNMNSRMRSKKEALEKKLFE